ncbi:hypothetical protein M0802_004520 [Mischocyttarus mexicanus]|nr:hypothetical protein M0802_004520 [Mischocyttarus mexicanus]
MRRMRREEEKTVGGDELLYDTNLAVVMAYTTTTSACGSMYSTIYNIYGVLCLSAGMEAANGAIEHDFHNALVPINGSHSGSSGRSTPNGGDPAPGKLFVGGLSWQTSSEKLREYFGIFGTVTDVLIMKDPVTQVGLST